MEFKDFVLEKLSATGDIKAKPMVGTFNIVLDGVNLGVICTRMGDSGRWYLKKTPAGDAFLAENNMQLETGIKGNSYIITDFSNARVLCDLAKITRDQLKERGNLCKS